MTEPLPSPFHAGEVAIQRSLGVAERMESFGRRVVRDHLPEQHRSFFAQLPFLVAACVDLAGHPWATLIEGRPGFAHSPQPSRLQLSHGPTADDPAAAGWRDGAAVGLLGIELHTRRRNRLNGVLRAAENGLQLAVEHAFGNCPQYIALRTLEFSREPGTPGDGVRSAGDLLDAITTRFIEDRDTFFVASYVDHDDGRRSVDASHRGGKPGFVRVRGQRLSIPDFAGNLHFNTLGNLRLNPRVGLIFVDFASGDLLQLSGRAVLDFEAAEVAYFQGAERLWHVDVETWVLRRGALALRASASDMSPNSALTGSWEEAAARQRAAALGTAWRPFRITRIEAESASISSFWLEPADGKGLAAYSAGQHLPLRMSLVTGEPPTERSYSLSSAPAGGVYRISVRAQGQVSRHLHRHAAIGSMVELRAPRGEFRVDTSARRPLVLISAGIGITPMLSMLRQVVYEGMRTRHTRRTWFVHGARTATDRAFAAEIENIVQTVGGAVTLVQALSQPDDAVQEGVDFQHHGRVDVALLKRVLPFDDFDFYLCGPTAFMQSIYAGLRELQVPDHRIHAEAFGPSGLHRDSVAALPAQSSRPVTVHFTAAGKQAQWLPGTGSLLDLAEASGLAAAHACRQGICGSCSHALASGSVTYSQPPAYGIAAGQALLCQAVPAEGSVSLHIDV